MEINLFLSWIIVSLIAAGDVTSTYYGMKKYGTHPEKGLVARKSVKKYGISKGLTIHGIIESCVLIALITALWFWLELTNNTATLMILSAYYLILTLGVLAIIGNVIQYFLGITKNSLMTFITITGLSFILALWKLSVSEWWASESAISWGIAFGCLAYWTIFGFAKAVLVKLGFLKGKNT